MRKVLSSLKLKLFGGKPAEERRKPHKPGPSPDLEKFIVGSFIFHHNLKMEVTETKSHELLKWLLKHGWHSAIRNDRRHYHLVPEDTYAKLDLASTSERPMMIRALMRQFNK